MLVLLVSKRRLFTQQLYYLCNFPHFINICFLIFNVHESSFNSAEDLFMVTAGVWESFGEVELWNVYGQRCSHNIIHMRSRGDRLRTTWKGGCRWKCCCRFLFWFILNLEEKCDYKIQKFQTVYIFQGSSSAIRSCV